MTVFASRRYHPQDFNKRFCKSQKISCHELESVYPSCSEASRKSQDYGKSSFLREIVHFGSDLRAEHFESSPGNHASVCRGGDLKQLFNEPSHLKGRVKHLTEDCSQGEFDLHFGNVDNSSTGRVLPTKLWYTTMLHADIATDIILHSQFAREISLTKCCGQDIMLPTEFRNGAVFRTECTTRDIFAMEFCICVMFDKKFVFCLVYLATLYYVWLLIVMEINNRVKDFIELHTRIMLPAEVCTRIKDPSEFCTRIKVSLEFCTRIKDPSEFCTRIKVPTKFCYWTMFPGGLGSIPYRTVGRRKQGEQKSGKQKKNGSKYGQKSESGRSRSTSQGNGSSGMEGSGEGSGNGDDSSDDEDDDDGDDEDQDDEDDDEEEDDEEEMDTDNVSAMAEDEAEDTTNGGGEEVSTGGGKVTSTTIEIHTTGIKDDVGTEDDQNTMTSLIAPVESGTPVTLSGVIWKETMGGVLVVNLKWRDKTYSGSLIDHSRYGWANPRNLEDPPECELSTSSRSSKGKKSKHKESAYTGNPLSPKMSGKRASRFHRNKGKHNKESSTKSKTKRGSDTAEEGTRTRRRSCTMKTSVSPSPSPTPFIECPERNCNKRYKHINGLRYHQTHAHLDNAGDGEDKDSFDEDDMKSCDFKEPLSANSKSSGSDDVKPLSHRKAKNQKSNSKTMEASPPNVAQNGEKLTEPEETGDKFDVTDIKAEDKYDVTVLQNEAKYDVMDVKTEGNYDVVKVEPEPEPMKVAETTTTIKPNILEEAVKIIFDEPAATQDFNVPTGIFSRMTSQALLAASHPPEYKYVGYEAMDQAVSDYDDKTVGETQELDVTVKEEVLDEGHAGEGKVSCKDESEITIKLENAEMRFNGAKSGVELPAEEATKSTEDEKTSKLLPPEKAGKSRKGDGAKVAKEQMKTSAAEIRLLPGYKHFRVSPNNPGFLTPPKSLTLDTGLVESKDPQKGGIPKETPRQERAGEKAKGNSVEWKIQGAASASSASFQLKCESKGRPGYMASSRKPSVVTANTTWFPAVSNKISSGGVLPGQEVLPEKPVSPREAAETIPQAHEPGEDQDDERTKADKGDDERSKGSYSGKPARAVGVAHPFNAEKSEGEFALGMVGSITTDPARVLYAKSSSPKMSVDVSHPDMTEVKKVRVEKTLEVPIGQVVPLGKSNRAPVCTSTARGAVMVGSDARGNFSDARSPVTEERIPQIIAPSPPPREPQQPYMSSSAERSSPWRPSGSHSPLREHEPRSRGEAGQQYTSTETYTSRKPIRRSPVPDHRSPSFRGGYLAGDIGRRTPEKDYPHRAIDKRIPFRNIDERLTQKDSLKGMEVARNSPGKDVPGGLHHSRSDSPRKDTPGPFPHRLTVGYRDPERRSPFSNEARKRYDKSPIRDRRSPTQSRRSPEVERSSFRDTSPNPMRETARNSPYRERAVKQPGEGEVTSQRKDSRSPVGESRTVEVSRGYRMKPEALTTKESGDSLESQRSENKFPRMAEEAMIHAARNTALYHQFQAAAASAQDAAASREAMENYMMYLSRMSLSPGFDPRLMQTYPAAMLTAAQMPLLFQSAKENAPSKDERLKELPDDIRGKTHNVKSEVPRSRAEASDVEVMASKRHVERTSSSREKPEYESSPMKRSKMNEMKDVHEIIDEREGGKMQLKALEQRASQQRMQHKMDALNQLQTEKNLKLKAEERFIRSKPSTSSSTSRLKPTIQESRTATKREDKGFSKEEKSRLSPVSAQSLSSNISENSRSRNPENKSPLPPTSAAYLNFVPTSNLPANHALSNSYEQAMAMQANPYLFMSAPFQFPGMMMANSALVPGGQLHGAVVPRGLDPKRDLSRSTSSSSDRARPRDDESHEKESRSESRDFSSKKEAGTVPRINPPTSPPMEKPKEKPRGEYEEGKQRRDAPSLHGSQALPANLAYRRADMSGGGFDPAHLAQAFPGMLYAGPQGTFRPAYDHPFMSHQRK